MILGSEDIHALLIEDLMGCNVPTEETKRSLEVMLKVLENIKNYPEQTKFRLIKLTNAVISQMVSLEGAFELLNSCGFKHSESNTLEYVPSEYHQQIVLKVYRFLGPRIRTMEIINKVQPHILQMVNQRKAKTEAQKTYKRKLVEQIEFDRQQYKIKNKKL